MTGIMLQASITPSQPAASSAVSGLRNFKPRTILALLAAIVICGVLVQWLAHRANSVSTSDARVAADLIAISAEISGTITAAHVRVGDRVESGDLIYEIDDREHVLQLEAQIAQRDGLQVQIEQTRMRVGLLNSKSGTQIDATQADERSAMAGVGAARSDLTTKQEEFDRFEKLFDRGRVTQDALDSAANALEAARQTLRAAQADVSSAAAKTRQAFLSVEDSDLVAQDLQILEAKVRQANAQIEEQKELLDACESVMLAPLADALSQEVQALKHDEPEEAAFQGGESPGFQCLGELAEEGGEDVCPPVRQRYTAEGDTDDLIRGK